MLPRFCFQESAAGFRTASVAKRERKGQPTFLDQWNPLARNCLEFCLLLYIISIGLQQQCKNPKPSLQFQAACEESKASCSVGIVCERLWRVWYANALAKRPRRTAHVPSATMATRGYSLLTWSVLLSCWWHASVSHQQLFSRIRNPVVFVGSLSRLTWIPTPIQYLYPPNLPPSPQAVESSCFGLQNKKPPVRYPRPQRCQWPSANASDANHGCRSARTWVLQDLWHWDSSRYNRKHHKKEARLWFHCIKHGCGVHLRALITPENPCLQTFS